MTYIKEDRNKLSQLYTKIANEVVSELPADWTNFCLGFFVDTSGKEDMVIYASYDEGKTWHDFIDDAFEAENIMYGIFDCKATCRELRQQCAKIGDKWTRFTLMVNKLGEFSADFKYEEYEEINEYYKKIWLGDYLE